MALLCPKCGKPNEENRSLCDQCGSAFQIEMPAQHRMNPIKVIGLIFGLVFGFFYIFNLIWPNVFDLDHMNPQNRSMPSRVRNDLRAITSALEQYYVDHQSYPAWSADPARNAFGHLARERRELAKLPTFTLANGSQLAMLTTPVAYITSLLADPYASAKGTSFCYWANDRDTTATGWLVWSAGPDGAYDLTLDNVAQVYDPAQPVPSARLIALTYDPSNGTTSRGDIWRQKQ